MTNIRRYDTTGRLVFIIAVCHRRIPYLKSLVGQVAPQALPDIWWSPRIKDLSGNSLRSHPDLHNDDNIGDNR